MKKSLQLAQLVLVCLFLSACGGGGGGGSTPPPPPVNTAPTSNAGPDQSVDENTTVTLAGTGSDSDGTISSFAWTQSSGPTVTLSDASIAAPTFDAPSTGNASSVTVVLTLTVTDDDGATGSDSVSITVNTTNQSPMANAGPDQSVDEQSTVNLDGAGSSDPDGSVAAYVWTQTGGQNVTLSGADTATPSFTSPAISSQEILTFSLVVTDDRGTDSTADVVEITVNPVPTLNIPPTADAGADQSATSNQVVNLDGSNSSDIDGTIISYAWSQTAGPEMVSINNATMAMASFTAPVVTADTTYTFELVVTDNEGSSASDSVDVIVSPAPSSVTITGKATYDNVPHNTVTNGLNYAGTTQDPIRRAVVELIQGATIIHSDLTDIDGNYSFTVNPNSGSYFVRIKARTLLTGAASWDVLVVDNTNSQAIYALDGSSFEVLTSDINRPTMNAGSGWGGSSYTGARAAAPFHILDRLVDGKLKLLAVDPNLTMPSVDVNWSVNNSPTSGSSDQLTNLRNGDIGTSFYSTFPSSAAEFAGPQFFILGTQDVDTDEYDGHVVVHEWGHYFENVLSRSDSLGGAHAGGDRLDMRVAFGEGFGNAWSAIITDDTFYRDSLDSQQSQGFSFNMESNSWSNPGWYSEGSVQSALYDFYDSADDGVDTLSLGLAPIYEVLTGLQITTEAFTSIFSFSEYLRQQNSGDTVAINAILAGQSITGDGIYGLNETNDAGAVPSSNVLPVYTELVVDGGFKQLCSVDDYDSTGQTANSGNKLSNFRFVYFTIPSNGNYSFLVSSGATQDIDMPIYQMGQDTGFFAAPGGDGDPGDAGDSTFTMTAGNYTAEVYEFDNTFRGNTANSSDECFTVEIVTAP